MNSNNIFDIFAANVAKNPDKCALIFAQKKYTYGELYDAVLGFKTVISPGAHVAVLLENSIEFVVLLLLASRDNFVLVPFISSTPQKQLDKLFKEHDIDMLIASDAIKQFSNVEKQANDNYIIVSTSGSTSDPKPIVLTQQIKLNRISSAQLVYNLGQEDVMLVSTPMHHSLAQRGVLLPLMLGATAVIMQEFTPGSYIKAIKAHRVTFSFSVASQLESLVDFNCDNISSLKTIVSSSYTLKVQSKLKLIDKLGCDLHECYGTSEIGCATDLSPSNLLSKTASVGQPLVGVDIEIINHKKGIGEIVVKTPTRFKEYYKKPQETAQAFIGEFFKTGDLGYIEDGFLYYVGRTKELIKTGSMSIYPIDIESVILKVEGVKECAVVGVADEYFGEVIVAVVIGDVSKSALRKACSLALSPYQQPMHYALVDSLPKNKLGKLQKYKLQNQYASLNIGKKIKGLI